MQLSEVEVGAVYTYDPHTKKRYGSACSTSGQPAVIISKEKMEVKTKDNCNRPITRMQTRVLARIYKISAGNDNALNLEFFNRTRNIFEEKYVAARHLIWPWKDEVDKVRLEMEVQRRAENVGAFSYLMEHDVARVLGRLGFRVDMSCRYSRGCGPSFGVTLKMPRPRNSKGDPRYYSVYQEGLSIDKEEPDLVFFNRLQEVLKNLVGDLEHASGIDMESTMLEAVYNPAADYITPMEELRGIQHEAEEKQRKRDDKFYSKKALEAKKREAKIKKAKK